MTKKEVAYALFAILFVFGYIIALFLLPELRHFKYLIPVSLLGVTINIGLLFIVLRDILLRTFKNSSEKYIWIAAVLLFWPAILYYLPKYGIKDRSASA